MEKATFRPFLEKVILLKNGKYMLNHYSRYYRASGITFIAKELENFKFTDAEVPDFETPIWRTESDMTYIIGDFHYSVRENPVFEINPEGEHILFSEEYPGNNFDKLQENSLYFYCETGRHGRTGLVYAVHKRGVKWDFIDCYQNVLQIRKHFWGEQKVQEHKCVSLKGDKMFLNGQHYHTFDNTMKKTVLKETDVLALVQEHYIAYNTKYAKRYILINKQNNKILLEQLYTQPECVLFKDRYYIIYKNNDVHCYNSEGKYLFWIDCFYYRENIDNLFLYNSQNNKLCVYKDNELYFKATDLKYHYSCQYKFHDNTSIDVIENGIIIDNIKLA